MTRADRMTAVGLFIVAFVTYAYFFNGGGWNQNAQFDLTRALVERQVLYIDEIRSNTGDIAWSNTSGTWHAYINKPPGVSLLAAIPYAIIRPFGFPTWLNAYLVTVLTCGVCGALIPVVLFGVRRRQSPLSKAAAQAAAGAEAGASAFESGDWRRRTPYVALSIAFGTIIFPYSTMLFAHVPAALFLLLAFVWLDDRPLLAGVAAGIASLCFYVCIPAALVLAIAAKRKALRFLAGGVPFAILLGAYHYLCFGSPFRTSVTFSKGFTQEGLFLGVLRKPPAEAMWGLTFSEYRGLFFASPILLLAFAGAVVMIRRRVMLRELATIGAIALIFFFVNASFNGWEGGFAFGPRYLLPVIPLLAIPMLFAWRNIFAILALLSIAIQFLATAVDPMPDGAIRRPLRDHILPAFMRGDISMNEQAVDELVPHKLYAEGSRESKFAAFNLGEFVFEGRASLIPIALWMIAGSAWLILRRRESG